MDKLGIDPAVRAVLIDELDIIINMAASISFSDHLHEALKINYYGATKVLELAKECKKL